MKEEEPIGECAEQAQSDRHGNVGALYDILKDRRRVTDLAAYLSG